MSASGSQKNIHGFAYSLITIDCHVCSDLFISDRWGNISNIPVCMPPLIVQWSTFCLSPSLLLIASWPLSTTLHEPQSLFLRVPHTPSTCSSPCPRCCLWTAAFLCPSTVPLWLRETHPCSPISGVSCSNCSLLSSLDFQQLPQAASPILDFSRSRSDICLVPNKIRVNRSTLPTNLLIRSTLVATHFCRSASKQQGQDVSFLSP